MKLNKSTCVKVSNNIVYDHCVVKTSPQLRMINLINTRINIVILEVNASEKMWGFECH